jgi:hypothetical protein
MAKNVDKMIEKPWLAQGRTVFYGQSSFDPVYFMQNLAAMKMKEDEAAAKKAVARQAEWKDFKWDQYQPKEIYQQNRAQIEKVLDEFGNLMSESFAAGLSPNDPSVRRRAEQFRTKMIELENEGKMFNDRYNSVMTKVKEDSTKYDPEVIKSWQAEIDKLPTIQEKRAYIDANNPLEEVFNIREVLSQIDLPTYIEQKRESNPNFFVEKGGIREEEARKLIRGILSDPKYTNQLAKEAKALAEKEKITIEDATEKVMKGYEDFALNLGDTKYIESGTPKSSTTINLGDQGDKTGDYVVKPYNLLKLSGLGSGQKLAEGINAIAIQTDKEMTLKPIEFTPYQGDPSQYVPLDVVVVEEANGNKIKVIRANASRGQTVTKISENETEDMLTARMRDKYGNNVKVEPAEDGKYTVTYLTPETVLLPYSDENKKKLPAATVEYIDKWFEKNFGSAAPAPKTKTAATQLTAGSLDKVGQ